MDAMLDNGLDKVSSYIKESNRDEFSSGPLSIYLNEIDKIPLLTREQEVNLAKRMAAGDLRAKELLIKSNLRFVVNIAKKYRNNGLPLIDLINEGNLGLIIAAERFDYTKGYHFISYAVWWIRQSILKALSEKARLIRLPLNRANELLQIEKVKREFSQRNGDNPSAVEIAELLDMKKNDVKDILNASKQYVSIESPLGSSDRDGKLSDLIEDANGREPEQDLIQRDLKDTIRKTLETLSENEREVIKYRFGLEGVRPMSLKELGKMFGLTKERIRQIEKKAIKRLKHPSRRHRLEDYVSG
ncbi:MAG: RNA polymerase sigma factor RpoD/SigA [Spirochaetota bacterium]|jgi:RNA polymerase primary sigma factor|nr:RNA polymerase sigma factor RpoD/SigA [Spirochaetota bacterium]